ncbi:MAG: hypothetical protein DRP45_10060 [Candidatus Zixiibacteriota bacterium]|nr:MAG: hypothetical protein DRP45_10060 [candidate division Zixibacteria bacterium]
MNKQFLTLTLLLVLVSFSLQVRAESPWPMFRHDQQHTGRTDFTGPATPTLAWTFQANDGITASPTIGHNGTIYIGAGGYYGGGGDSSLYALTRDGNLKWEFKTDFGDNWPQAAGIFSSAAIGPDGTIYFGSLDGFMYAIEDSVTYAKLRWKNNPGVWPFYSSPIISPEGTVYAGSLDFRLYAFGSDGQVNWSFPTSWCIFSSAVFGLDNVIHVGSKDHNLYSFRDLGAQVDIVWTHPVGTFYDGHLIDGSPAIGDDGTIYFGSDPYGAFGQTPVPVDTTFWAVNPDGTRKWAFVMGDGVESSPAIGHDGTIYVGSYDSCVYAIEDSVTYGKLKWKFKTDGTVDASPTVDGDGTIYIGSRDSVLYALHPDGTVKWTFETEGGIESSVTVDELGYVYFGSFDGRLYALGTGAPDVGIKSVNVPDQVQAESWIEPVARVSNFRDYPQSFDVVCQIDDASQIVYADTLALTDVAGGQYDYMTFAPMMVSSSTSVVYTVSVTTMLPSDNNTYNNTESSQMTVVSGAQLECGDIDGDGDGPDIADVIVLANYILSDGPQPPFLEAADVDGSGAPSPDVADLLYLVDFVFQNGPEPDCGL